MKDNPYYAKPAALRPQQAADVLGISRALLYQLLAEEKLQSIKIGRARLIKMSSIEALLND